VLRPAGGTPSISYPPGGWSWGLELEQYGFAGSEQRVTTPERVSAEGGRVSYAWDSILEEWYENDTRGLGTATR